MSKSNLIQNIIIYGDSDFAEQAYNQIESDGRYKVLGFTVDEAKYSKNNFNGLPILIFQSLSKYYSSEEILIFPAIGYSRSNIIRRIVSLEIQNAGFKVMTYISKHAFIGNDVKIGSGCYISEFVSIGSRSEIGNGVILLPHCSVAHDVIMLDFSFISHSVTIGGKAVVRNNTFVGLNVTIKNGIEVAEYNIIGSAANVIKSTKANGVYVGNPAKRIKEVDLNAHAVKI